MIRGVKPHRNIQMEKGGRLHPAHPGHDIVGTVVAGEAQQIDREHRAVTEWQAGADAVTGRKSGSIARAAVEARITAGGNREITPITASDCAAPCAQVAFDEQADGAEPQQVYPHEQGCVQHRTGTEPLTSLPMRVPTLMGGQQALLHAEIEQGLAVAAAGRGVAVQEFESCEPVWAVGRCDGRKQRQGDEQSDPPHHGNDRKKKLGAGGHDAQRRLQQVRYGSTETPARAHRPTTANSTALRDNIEITAATTHNSPARRSFAAPPGPASTARINTPSGVPAPAVLKLSIQRTP